MAGIVAIDFANEIFIRWDDPDPRYAPLLKQGGITVAWAQPNESFEKACAAAGVETLAAGDLQTLRIEELGQAKPGVPVAVNAGTWPGVRGRDVAVASATRSLWVDANGFRIAYLRALYPKLTPLLAYRPGGQGGRAIPYGSLELALVEAWAAGGNCVLAPEPSYRGALLRGEERASAAWRSLGQTAGWLRQHVALFRQKALPIVTVLVDPGDTSAEVANLMYRQNVSPALEAASDPPNPDPSRREVLVAAGIAAPKPEIAERIRAHAQAGTSLVVDDPSEKAWWRTAGLKLARSWRDRDLFVLGKGQVLAYKEPISDPGELALDVIDLVTHKRRPVRLFNCQAGIALATSAPGSGPVTGRAVLHVVNYSSPVDVPVLAQIQGSFTRATILRPEAAPLEVPVARRGTASEVALRA